MATSRRIVNPDAAGPHQCYAAMCEPCGWEGIPSLFRFYAEADALDHDAAKHGGAPRKKSALIDGVARNTLEASRMSDPTLSEAVYWYKRFPDFPHATVVRVEDEEPGILFWHGQSGVDDEPDAPPRTYSQLTANEARALGEALIRAADRVGEILPFQCDQCAEPTEDHLCPLCWMKANKARAQERRFDIEYLEGLLNG